MRQRLARPLWAAHRLERRVRRPAAIFLGDSITREWLEGDPRAFLLRGRINAGVNGQTTRDMLARFDTDVVARRPRLVHIMAGTNDLWHGDPGEAAEASIANLAGMIRRAAAAGIRAVVAQPPPIAPRAAPLFRQADLFPILRAGIAALCAEHDVALVDYAPALGDGAGGIRPEFTTDGVHLSAAGYRAMRPRMEQALRGRPADRSGP